jgi:hypothetical protein
VPGWKKDLESIQRKDFASQDFRWMDAYVACPSCDKAVDLNPAHREWVIENPDAAFPRSGYRVSPFDCPGSVTAADLVKSSVEYERKQDFYNQRLGIPLEDKENSLTREEMAALIVSGAANEGVYSNVFGLDMGTTCWMTIGSVLPDNTLIIRSVIPIPLYDVMERVPALARSWKCRVGVADFNPYGETIYRLQKVLPNLFAGVYTSAKGIDLYKVKDRDEDREKGQEDLRQVNIARDRGFDLLLSMMKLKQVVKVSDEYDQTWIDQLSDQKRVREFRQDELVFVWRKTAGNDHLHHSLLYTMIASRMMGVAGGCSVALPLLFNFKVKKGAGALTL